MRFKWLTTCMSALLVTASAGLLAQQPIRPLRPAVAAQVLQASPGAEQPGTPQGVEPPEPPNPPDAPEAPEPPPAGSDMFLIGDGGTWLGVRLRDITAEKARELKLSGEYGALVMEVEPSSPAAKAGIEKNDVIVQFAGERVQSVAQLQRLVRETPSGRTVSIEVSRTGKTRALTAKLDESWNRFKMPNVRFPAPHWPEFGHFTFDLRGPTLGIEGEELTGQLAQYFGVKQGKGVLVREVKEGSAAAKAGLKAGDVVVRVDGKEVASVEELRRALPHDLHEKKKVDLSVVRDRREQTMAVELEPAARAPLRRVDIDIPQIDLAELRRAAAEAGRQAARFQEEMKNYGRELNEQTRRWQREWQRQWQQEQQKLKEKLGREIRLERGRMGEGVI